MDNSIVVGFFMIPIRQWRRLECVTVECTCLLHIGPPLPSNFITWICSGLVVQVVSALLRGNWQDFNWQRIARSLGDSWASCVHCYQQTSQQSKMIKKRIKTWLLLFVTAGGAGGDQSGQVPQSPARAGRVRGTSRPGGGRDGQAKS